MHMLQITCACKSTSYLKKYKSYKTEIQYNYKHVIFLSTDNRVYLLSTVCIFFNVSWKLIDFSTRNTLSVLIKVVIA